MEGTEGRCARIAHCASIEFWWLSGADGSGADVSGAVASLAEVIRCKVAPATADPTTGCAVGMLVSGIGVLLHGSAIGAEYAVGSGVGTSFLVVELNMSKPALSAVGHEKESMAVVAMNCDPSGFVICPFVLAVLAVVATGPAEYGVAYCGTLVTMGMGGCPGWEPNWSGMGCAMWPVDANLAWCTIGWLSGCGIVWECECG